MSKLCENCVVEHCADRNRGQVIFCSSHAAKKVQTHADQIRAMSDEELATAIWAAFNDNDYLGKLFCDGKAGCLLECGDFDCDDNKEKDCVLRWLQQPAEVSGDA